MKERQIFLRFMIFLLVVVAIVGIACLVAGVKVEPLEPLPRVVNSGIGIFDSAELTPGTKPLKADDYVVVGGENLSKEEKEKRVAELKTRIKIGKDGKLDGGFKDGHSLTVNSGFGSASEVNPKQDGGKE
ncbi:MAG: hypothetical protein ABII97_00555 [Patescibacteria group bacterium]